VRAQVAALCLAVGLLPGALPAQAERHIEGLPFVFEHRWGSRDDGTEFSRWRAGAGMWNSESLTYPDGTEGRRVWFAPLFAYTANVDGFTQWALMWPAPLLAHRWRSDGQSDHDEWTALFWLFHRKSVTLPSGVVDLDWWLMPGFLRTTDPDGDVAWWLTWPLPLIGHNVDNRADGRRTDTWRGLLWLWSLTRTESAQGDLSVRGVLLPLADWHTGTVGESRRWGWAFPLLPLPIAAMERDSARHFALNYFFPVIWGHEGEDPEVLGHRQRGLLPLFFQRRERTDQTRESLLWLFPYFDQRWVTQTVDPQERTRTGRTQVFPPWFHSRRVTKSQGERVQEEDWGILPVTWGRIDDRFDHLHVWPIFFWKPDKHLFAFPVLWWGEDYTYVVPFYGRSERRHDDSVHETEFLLFPLWHRETEHEAGKVVADKRNVLWPLITWRHWENARYRHVLPLWLHSETSKPDGRETLTSVLPPLIWRGREERGGETVLKRDIVLPLFWRKREHLQGRLDEAFDFVIPLWARHREWQDAERLDRAIDVVIPLWLRYRDWSGDRLTDSWDVLFPLWWDFQDFDRERRLTGLAPLWFREAVRGETRRLSVLWPLIQMRWPDPVTAAPEDPSFALSVAWILGGFERWADGDILVDLLGGPLWQRDREGAATGIRLLWHLWRRESDPEADTARAALLWRFLEYTREGDDRDLRLLFLPWRIALP
jgi:hypothetical protein